MEQNDNFNEFKNVIHKYSWFLKISIATFRFKYN